MNRALWVLAFWLGLSPASAFWQSRDSNYNVAVSAGGGFTPSCTPSTNFLARATGITSNTDKTRYDTLICGLNSDAVLSLIDGLYVFAAPDQTTALLNLTQNSFNGTAHGTVSFSAFNGFTGDAATFFIDTGYSANAGGGNFTINSATLGCYVLSSRTVQQNWSVGGVMNSNDFRLVPLQAAAGGGTIYEINDNNAANLINATTNAKGLWMGSRTSSALTTLYLNNLGSQSTSSHGSGSDSQNIYLFANNNVATTGRDFSGDQMSACFFSAGLNSTQINNVQSRLNTFMTAYGINVY